MQNTSDARHEAPSSSYYLAYEMDGFVFVSGALSIDTDGEAVGGRGETLDAAMNRMAERLATAGGRLHNVVKLTYFVTDVTLRDEANRQFERCFSEPRPARTFLEVSRLPYGATVEVDCIAHLPKGQWRRDGHLGDRAGNSMTRHLPPEGHR